MGKPIKKRRKRPTFTPSIPPAQFVKVRELRAHFKQYLELGAPMIVGHAWRAKAVILPVVESWESSDQSRKLRRARLRACLEAALESLSH